MTAPMPTRTPSAWTLACVVARLFASDPFGTGIHVKAPAGPVRDRFLGMLRAMMPVEAPWRRCPATIADDRLLGGLDLGAALATGQAMVSRGLLAEANGGIVVVGTAERLSDGTAARLGAVLDQGEVVAERDGFAIRHPARIGLVLLDEGTEEDIPAGLRDRLAFRIDLDSVRLSETTETAMEAEAHPGPVAADFDVVEALCATAGALGIGSARAEWLALRVARAAAAVAGRAAVSEADAMLAAQLVLAHRATRMPQGAPEEAADDAEQDRPQPEDTDGAQDEADMDQTLAEAVLAATVASLPPDVLAELVANRGSGRLLGVDREHDALVAERAGELVDQLWPLQGRRVDRDLVGAGVEHRLGVGDRADPAADRERDEQLVGDPAGELDDGGALVGGRGDVEQHELVGTRRVIVCGQRHRVAGVAQIDERDPLDHAPAVDVEAGDHALVVHG